MLTQHLRKGLTLAVGLGAGIGLMAGGILWSLGATPPLTDAQIISRARSLGMVQATELAGARVTLVVKSDTTLADVAEMLKTSGLVADSDAFLTNLKARHPQGKPKPGVHVLSQGQTLEQIGDELVTGP